MLLDFTKKMRGSIIQHSEYTGTAKNTIFPLVTFGWVGGADAKLGPAQLNPKLWVWSYYLKIE